jgi:hypothetical protein
LVYYSRDILSNNISSDTIRQCRNDNASDGDILRSLYILVLVCKRLNYKNSNILLQTIIDKLVVMNINVNTININERYGQYNPHALDCAVFHNKLDIVNELINMGVDINHINMYIFERCIRQKN